MDDVQPYLAEYAKSNRSSCKVCLSLIGQGTLRVAQMVQSRKHDGLVSDLYFTILHVTEYNYLFKYFICFNKVVFYGWRIDIFYCFV